jgi:outer membrane protein assembly factor BamA
MTIEGNPQALGSSPNNEQLIFSGDLREYIPLPLEGHVLAFRVAGGIAFGDRLLQGTFRLGSALGEGTLAAVTPRLYTLRGLPQITFAGERAMLFSGEYRLPLVYPQRGAGTGPIQINKIYMVFFADYGSVFNGNLDFNNFLLGVGAELRGDFVIGYGLPITARLGYGIIVSGRQFIQGLTDPLLGTPVSDGTIILELGTSF